MKEVESLRDKLEYNEEEQQELVQEGYGEEGATALCVMKNGQFDLLSKKEQKEILGDYYLGIMVKAQNLFSKGTYKEEKENFKKVINKLRETEKFQTFEEKLLNSGLKGEHYAKSDIINAMGLMFGSAIARYESSLPILVKFTDNVEQQIGIYCNAMKIEWGDAGAHKTKGKNLKPGDGIKTAGNYLEELNGVDPIWMTQSSTEFRNVKSELAALKELEKGFKKGDDFETLVRNSGEYIKQLNKVKKACKAYIQRKERQFRDDPARRDSDSKQKWEQKRIKAVLSVLEGMEEIHDRIVQDGRKIEKDTFENRGSQYEPKYYKHNTEEKVDTATATFFSNSSVNHKKEFTEGPKEDYQQKLFSLQTKEEIGYSPTKKENIEKYEQERKQGDNLYVDLKAVKERNKGL